MIGDPSDPLKGKEEAREAEVRRQKYLLRNIETQALH
jgi:hypothetical protein